MKKHPESIITVDPPVEDKTALTTGIEKNTAERSKGEKWHEWATYKGLNYWANLSISMFIADFFRNGKGKKSLENVAHTLAKSGGKETTKFLEATNHLRTGSVFVGGWLLLIPMKYMEDNQRKVVHWLNEKMGVAQKDANGNELSADQIYIEKDISAKSWFNVVGRRFLATAAGMSTGFALNHALNNSTDGKPNGEDRAAQFVKNSVNWGVNKLPNGNKLTQTSAFQRTLEVGALDVFYSKITEVVMRITNGASKEDLPGEINPAHVTSKNESAQEPSQTLDKTPEKDHSHLKKPHPESAKSFTDMAQQDASTLGLGT